MNMPQCIKWLITDTRSSLVGSFVGSALAIAGSALAVSQNKEIDYKVITNDRGYAAPFVGIFEGLKLESAASDFVFEDADLNNVFVCEYAFVSGSTYKQIMLRYIDRYSMCFGLKETEKDKFTIVMNKHSGQLIQRGGTVACKCGQP